MMRLYRNLAEGVVNSLTQIFHDNEYADQVVSKRLKGNKKWGSKDRRFVAESIYDITRYARRYAYISEQELDSTTNFWLVFGAWALQQTDTLPDWDEFSDIDKASILKRTEEAKTIPKIWESYPDWLWEHLQTALGNKWEKEAVAQNVQANVVLRVNPLAIPKQERKDAVVFAQTQLAKEGIETEFLFDNAIQLKQRGNILHTKAYSNGWVEIQDANSQRVIPFTTVKPGMNVIDACAGAGGKSLHFASAMNDDGNVLALDVVTWKLDELEKRANRANASSIVTDIPDLANLINYKEQADVVLIDAPCSGVGTMKRKADLKWKLTETELQNLLALQAQLLQQYATLVQPGGVLVYATCSILPEENNQQVQHFLATELGGNFQLEEEQQLYAHTTNYDGFYMARLTRNK